MTKLLPYLKALLLVDFRRFVPKTPTASPTRPTPPFGHPSEEGIFRHLLGGVGRLLVLLCFLPFALLHAQTYPIEKFTTREGLVQNQVLCLHKDSRGYVWCGTWYGLSKFNGETFENYTKKEGFWNGAVLDIQEDEKGCIWLLGYGAIARFDGKTFKIWTTATENSLQFTKVMHQDVQFLSGGELMRVKGDTVVKVSLPNRPKGAIGGVIYHPQTQSYWLNINEKHYQYREGKVTPIAVQLPASLVLLHGQVFLIQMPSSQHQTHSFWDGQRVVDFLHCTPQKIEVRQPLAFPYFFEYRQRFYYLPAHSRAVIDMGVNPPLAHNLSFLNQTNTSPYFLPTEKGLWKMVSISAFKSFSQEQVPYAWSVVEDKQRNLYFLNYEVGIQRYDGKNLSLLSSLPVIKEIEKHRQTLPKAYQNYFNFKNQWYYHALRDASGAMWLPEANGVFRYDGNNWQFFRPSRMNSLAFCMAEDKKRGKIVAAADKHFYTIETRPPFRTDSLRGKTALFDGLVMCNVVGQDGDYWFSALGVERYNPDTKQWKAYTYDNGKLPIKGGNVLYEDWQGTLWMGGREVVCRYNPRTDRFETVLEGLFSKHIQFIEQIDADHLMIADSYNLYVLDLKQFNQNGKVQMKCFNHHNGFKGMEPGQLGSYRDSQGRIWITSSSVLSVLDPKQLDLSIKPLRTFITHINGQRVAFAGDIKVTELPFGTNTLSVRVESVGEDKPFRSQFSHRLDGGEWSDWQENAFITLSNLPNGTHTLQVRSRTGTLQATESAVAEVEFHTSVYFWKSPNFYWYASLVGIGLAVLLALLWWRDRGRSRKLIAQQKQIEERERQMRLLQTQTIQSQMNPHFMSNALSAIQKLMLQQENERASDNLLKIGRLMRAYLEDSLFKDEQTPYAREISLTRELSLLKMYVDLMQLQ
ncbi:MAG: histidine kinase, partial [Spirosomaceae bacterium]|nr:histidine kinase [Spirosomataceae bacterium]